MAWIAPNTTRPTYIEFQLNLTSSVANKGKISFTPLKHSFQYTGCRKIQNCSTALCAERLYRISSTSVTKSVEKWERAEINIDALKGGRPATDPTLWNSHLLDNFLSRTCILTYTDPLANGLVAYPKSQSTDGKMWSPRKAFLYRQYTWQLSMYICTVIVGTRFQNRIHKNVFT